MKREPTSFLERVEQENAYVILPESQQKLVDTFIVSGIHKGDDTHLPNLHAARNTLAKYIRDMEENRGNIEADAKTRGIDPQNPVASFPPPLKAQLNKGTGHVLGS